MLSNLNGLSKMTDLTYDGVKLTPPRFFLQVLKLKNKLNLKGLWVKVKVPLKKVISTTQFTVLDELLFLIDSVLILGFTSTWKS